jgi:hypothetical protein
VLKEVKMKPTYTSKYEATKHMKRHIIVTTTTEARAETTRWRQREDNFKFSKQSGIQDRIDQKIEESNLRLSQRILEVVTEDRQNRTSEYAPGWRTGLCKFLLQYIYVSLLTISFISSWNCD